MKRVHKIFSAVVFAVIIIFGASNIEAVESVKVNFRVEGYDKTLLEKREINVSPNDISKYVGGSNWEMTKPVVTHVVVQALLDAEKDPTDPNVLTLQEGTYISNFLGLKTGLTGNMDGWMYTVNNVIAPVGISQQEVKEGDNIVFYFTTNYTENKYSFFDKEQIDVEKNQEIVLKNGSAFWDMNGGEDVSGVPIEGAYLILEHEDGSIEKRKDVVSDKNGLLKFKIEKSGTYRAYTWLGNEEYNKLSRAYTKIVVNKSMSNYATKLIDYLPAPGQFTNEKGWSLNPSSVLDDPKDGGVSLGGFGGYIVLGFDSPIKNNPKNPYGIDFTVFGNGFKGNEEAGSVMVMKDENGNGKADDTWYELAGSQHFEEKTIRDYQVTYTNPKKHANVEYVDNKGGSGVVKVNSFHKQNYYPEYENYKDFTLRTDYNNDTMVLDGTLVNERKGSYGYADVKPVNSGNDATMADNPYIVQDRGVKAGGDGFDISWAIDKDGNKVELDQIDFVKVYNSNQLDAGMFGEVSPEVVGIAKAASNNKVETTANATKIELVANEGELKGFNYEPNKTSYNLTAKNVGTVNVKITSDAANIYVNNVRFDKELHKNGVAVDIFDNKIIRVVIQDGENTPIINHIKVGFEKKLVNKVEPVATITVENNIKLAQIISKLPKQVTVVDTNNGKSLQNVDWTIDNYVAGAVKEYQAKGEITLADGYAFENAELEAQAKVIVKKQETSKVVKSGNNSYYYLLKGDVWFNNKAIIVKGNTTHTYTYAYDQKRKKQNAAIPQNAARILSRDSVTKKGKKIVKKQTVKYNNNTLLATDRVATLNKKNRFVITHASNRSYYANKKVKQVYTIKRNLSSNKVTSKQKLFYRSNGKRLKTINVTYKNNKVSKRVEYRYNKAGILKSNKKYGNSYRFITSYSKKGKATKTVRIKYNGKGKAIQKKNVKVVTYF